MDQNVTQATAPNPSIADIRAAQNFPLAVIAGLAAALAGAVLWAAATVTTHMQLGIVSVGIGLLIGYAIRKTGHGIDDKFRYLGAACAVLGCAVGTVLTDVALLADYKHVPLMDVTQSLQPGQIPTMIKVFAKPMDGIFVLISVYEAFKVSRRWKVTKPTKN